LVDAEPITVSELSNLVSSGSISSNRIKDETSQEIITLHELDREFLFIGRAFPYWQDTRNSYRESMMTK
jgi:hypothetical protein